MPRTVLHAAAMHSIALHCQMTRAIIDIAPFARDIGA